MERRHAYEGFIIEAQPYELHDEQGWKTEFYIEEHDGSGVNVTQFFLPTVFGSEDEAIRGALEAGKRKIDSGFHPVPVAARVSESYTGTGHK